MLDALKISVCRWFHPPGIFRIKTHMNTIYDLPIPGIEPRLKP